MEQEIEIDIKELFFVLWDKAWMIILATLVAMTAAALVTRFLITPIYVSTSSVYVMNRQNADGFMTSSDISVATSLTKDYESMIKSNVVLEGVIADVGLGCTTGELAAIVSVENPQGTRFLEISIRHSKPLLARDIADSFARISAEKIVELMGVEKVNIVDKADLPTSPSSPNLIKNILMAGVVGFIAVCGVILTVYMLNDRINTADDVEKYLGVSVLGTIPLAANETVRKKKGGKRVNR